MTITDLIGNAGQFPVLARWDFFNHAGVAPIPRASADAVRRYADQAETDVYLGTGWYQDVERLRVALAAMLNAHRDEIALVKNTSEGISIVAFGQTWREGDVIVTSAVEYPANIYPWMELQRRHGVKLVMVPEESDEQGRRVVREEKILQAASDPRTKLVALSHVEFASGQRLDVARIGAFCRQRGIRFSVDAIQSLGVLPVDVQAMNIDYLSADGHKWLLGPEGAGVFYCRRDLIDETRPPTVGWMNVIDAQDYGHYDYTLKPDAARFECGTWNIPGFIGFKASVELLLSLGVDAIQRRLQSLGDRLVAGVERKGYQILSPRDGQRWSGIVSFASRTHRHEQIVRLLRTDYRTEIALREGRLRVSPHFYNVEDQIDRLVDHLPGH